MAAEYIRCEPDDPRRCQGTNPKTGQCIYLAIEGLPTCPLHMKRSAHALKQKEAYNYQLTKYRARVHAFADNPKVKSLREEIGVLRLLLETTLNRCQNDNQLLIYSGKIGELVAKIEKVVTSCNTIETKTGQLLDKQVVATLVDSILQILTLHIEDSDSLEAIGVSIMELLGEKYTSDL